MTEPANIVLKSGADKVAINTQAIKTPSLISDVSNRFGSQCMVLSIEAKKISEGKWEAFTDNGREHTGLDVLEWVKKGVSLGAGEILLTSVDQEGTKKGFDVELVRRVTAEVDVPVIASGGMGNVKDMVEVVRNGGADAVAMADILHYNRDTISSLRASAIKEGLKVRKYETA